MSAAPKFVHIAAPVRRFIPDTTRRSLCGRLVGIMSLGNESDATCPKCLAESLTRPAPAAKSGP